MTSFKRLRDAVNLWVGTPYMAGQAVQGVGVDCVRLVDEIMQDALGLDLDPLPRFASDSAYHNAEVVAKMQRLLFERFDLENVAGQHYMMGDILALSQKVHSDPKHPDNPHHICILVTPNTACDAWPGSGARIVGMGGIRAGFHILKHWRSRRFHA